MDHYDAKVRRLRVLRSEFELNVAQKTIKTTGKGPDHIEKATRYEMKRLSDKERLLVEVRLRVEKGARWDTDEELHQLIQTICRDWSGAVTKGADGTEPTEQIYLTSVMEVFGCPGGKVDRLAKAVRAAAQALWGVDLSRSTIYSAAQNAGVKYLSTKNNLHDPVLQQHYCRSHVMT